MNNMKVMSFSPHVSSPKLPIWFRRNLVLGGLH